MQVDPIKSTLKAPGIKLLKLEHDKPLSNFAFKFNLRRYNTEELRREQETPVGRCRLTVSKPVLKAPVASALKAKK